jgi:biotin carboxyl carrier protein
MGSAIEVHSGDSSVAVSVIADHGIDLEVSIDGHRQRVRAVATLEGGWLDAFGVCTAFVDLADSPPERGAGAGGGAVMSRMHGALVKLAVSPGQKVARGEFLLAIEAMKMEHRIEAPVAGTVVEVGVAAGAHVAPGRLLVRIEPETAG